MGVLKLAWKFRRTFHEYISDDLVHSDSKVLGGGGFFRLYGGITNPRLKCAAKVSLCRLNSSHLHFV